MNKLKKLFSLILVICLAACECCMVCSCSKDAENNAIKVYYTNVSRDDLVSLEYIPSSSPSDTELLVNELLDQMFNKDYQTEQCFSVKPDGVAINSVVIDEVNTLNIDFNDAYLQMTNVQEIILRAAAVLTLIQIDKLNGVKFTVDGNPITYSDGEVIGTMTADDFVNILLTETGMLKQETDVLLYFTNESGTLLMPVTSHFVTSSNNTSMELYIVESLIAGPGEGSGVYPVMSNDVELISVVSSDNICYVNFGESFLEQEAQPVSDEILIYSIVNSLCRLSYIDKVQFLIDGENADKMHTVTDLSQPFSRNKNLEMVYDY